MEDKPYEEAMALLRDAIKYDRQNYHRIAAIADATAMAFGTTPFLALMDALCDDCERYWDIDVCISYEKMVKLMKPRFFSCNREYLDGIIDALGAVYDKELFSLSNDLLVTADRT